MTCISLFITQTCLLLCASVCTNPYLCALICQNRHQAVNICTPVSLLKVPHASCQGILIALSRHLGLDLGLNLSEHVNMH